MASAAAAAAIVEVAHEVHLPPTYVLRGRHVSDALKGVPDDAHNVTVWIHSSTLGIGENCFRWMTKRLSRILVSSPEPHDVGTHPPVVAAAALSLLIAKLAAYEPALVDLIHGLPTHNKDEEHRALAGKRSIVAED
jgi:hypothetical protein